jgi:hypothetical protein
MEAPAGMVTVPVNVGLAEFSATTEPPSVFVKAAPVVVLIAISPTTSCPAVGVVVPLLCLIVLAIVLAICHQNEPPSIVTPSIVPPVMETEEAAWVAIVPNPRLVRAVEFDVRSDRLLDLTSFSPKDVEIVVANDASLPSAVANSFRVSRAADAPPIRLLTAVETKAVVATWVVLVPAVAVGAAGVPVRVGEARGA